MPEIIRHLRWIERHCKWIIRRLQHSPNRLDRQQALNGLARIGKKLELARKLLEQ